jgi:hypothetical protein
MTISFMPYVHDGRRDIWVFPDQVRDDIDSYEVNLSNVNAVDVLAALGLPPETNVLAIDVFANLVTAALRRHLGHRSSAIEPSVDHQPGRIAIIDCGRAEGYIETRLGHLARLVQRSRAISATHIGWG